MQKNEGVKIQSVVRAAEILQCFRGNNKELGISEIADRMCLSKSTTFGLVNTLKSIGYLEQNQENKKYRLGIKLFELGNLVQNRMDLRNEARSICQTLANEYDNSINLAIYDEGEIVYIDRIDVMSYDVATSHVATSRVGKRSPMHCTATGKSILAFVEESYLEKYIFSKPLIKLTNNTITTCEKLIEELQFIRSKGYAIDNEEIEIGIRCVGTPIFNEKGYPVAAISLSAPYRKMSDKEIEKVAQDIKSCALKISERLGYYSCRI